MEVETLTLLNLKQLTELVLELWTDCLFEEEYMNYKTLLDLGNEVCYLIREGENYVAFIHLSVRSEYVEGAAGSPLAYIEALYVRPDYRHLGIAKKLVSEGEAWATKKGMKQLGSDTEITNSGSIDFHKQIGFEEVNRIVCFIKRI